MIILSKSLEYIHKNEIAKYNEYPWYYILNLNGELAPTTQIIL